MGRMTIKLVSTAGVDMLNGQGSKTFTLGEHTVSFTVTNSPDGYKFSPSTVSFPAPITSGLRFAEFKGGSSIYSSSQPIKDDGTTYNTYHELRYDELAGKTVDLDSIPYSDPNYMTLRDADEQNLTITVTAYSTLQQTSQRSASFRGKVVLTYDDSSNSAGLRPSSDSITLDHSQLGRIGSGVTPWSFSITTSEDKLVGDFTAHGSSPYYTYEESSVSGCMYVTDFDGQEFAIEPGSDTITVEATVKASAYATIIWNDYGNFSRIRPSSVKVDLYQNGSFVTSKTASGGSTAYSWPVLFPGVGDPADGSFSVRVSGASGYSNSVDGLVATYSHQPKKKMKLSITGNGDYGAYHYTLTKNWKDFSGLPAQSEVVSSGSFDATGGTDIDLGEHDVMGGSANADPYPITYTLDVTQAGSTQPIKLEESDEPQATTWSFETINTPKINHGTGYKGMIPKIGTTFGIVGLTDKPIYVQLQQIDFVSGGASLSTNDSISLLK